MTERKAPDSGGEIAEEIFTSVKDELAQHDDLFSMLWGFRQWDSARVATALRSEQLSTALKLCALSCLADLIDGTDGTVRRLKLVGQRNHTHFKNARAEYDRVMQIGGWVQAQIDDGESYESAIYGASDEFDGVSDSTAQRALAVFRERSERAEKTGLWYPLLPVRQRQQSRKKKRD